MNVELAYMVFMEWFLKRKDKKGFADTGETLRPSENLQPSMPTTPSPVRPGRTPGYSNVKPLKAITPGVVSPFQNIKPPSSFLPSTTPTQYVGKKKRGIL